MSDVGAYVSRLINEPWTRTGRHCWRLVVEVQRDLFGRTLPPVLDVAPAGADGRRTKSRLFAEHPERLRWRPSASVHGAVALMRREAAPAEMYVHAGVYLDLDGGGVLHSDAPHGVVFDSLNELQGVRHWAPPLFLVPV